MANLDNINLLKLCGYLTSVRIIRRLKSFAESHSGRKLIFAIHHRNIILLPSIIAKLVSFEYAEAFFSTNFELTQGSLTSLTNVVSFLSSLRKEEGDGRVVLIRKNFRGDSSVEKAPLRSCEERDNDQNDDVSLQYLCLNASSHFQQIADTAACVVLIGGTMQPFSQVKSSLLLNIDERRLRFFACPHVVSKANVLTNILTVGPDGTEFDFRFSSRLLDTMVTSLRLAIR